MVKKIQLRKTLAKRETSLIVDCIVLCTCPHRLTVAISISLKLEWRCPSSSECAMLELSLSLSEGITLCWGVDCWCLPGNTPLAGWLCDWNNRGVQLFVDVWEETGALKRAGCNKWGLLALDSDHEGSPASLFSPASGNCCRCSLLSSYHDLGVPLPLCVLSPIELQIKAETLQLHLKVHTLGISRWMPLYRRLTYRYIALMYTEGCTWTDRHTYAKMVPSCNVNNLSSGLQKYLRCVHTDRQMAKCSIVWFTVQ